ncbi:MAG: AIR synthase-related protein, partial [bacterium]|nr:AIR synthase-related protein [bacterium]
ITNCLNFGNPEKPEIFYQLTNAIRGMAAACRAFGTPVTGGNVSLYNETKGKAIYPTPTVGMIGLLSDISHRVTQGFKATGDSVFLLGNTLEELGGSEYLEVMHKLETGLPPALDLEREKQLIEVLVTAAERGITSSAHDCSEGGLAVALAESCISGNIGANISLQNSDSIRLDALLFGESQSRAVISVSPTKADSLIALALALNVPCSFVGTVGGDTLKITVDETAIIDSSVGAITKAWRETIPCLMMK